MCTCACGFFYVEKTEEHMAENYISSRNNQWVKLWASLNTKKGRDDNSLFLCEGLKLCREAVGNARVSVVLLKESKANGDVLAVAQSAQSDITVLADTVFDKISSDTSPDGIIFVCEAETFSDSISPKERVLCLECVRDPGNVGTVIRTAAAFGIDRIILCDCADIYNPKVLRASMGAAFKMSFTRCTHLSEIIPQLKKCGKRVVSAALTDTSLVLGKTPIYPDDCFIVGNEGHGISKEALALSDETVIIPMSGKTESLNAATAAAVLLWEAARTVEL